MTNIETLLGEISKIVVKEKTQQKEKRKRGENFNIFDVLGLSTSEVRLHSSFLAELLNPNGDHGLGDKFLEAFLKTLVNNKTIEPSFEINTKSCKVWVEYHIGTIIEDYSEGGRIDLLIQDNKNHAIVIENKINAGDQYKQLLRYHNWATKNSQKSVLLYLTKYGAEAEEYSAKNVPYKCISYKDDVLPWLQDCLGIASVHPIVRETIRQYITNLNQIMSIMSEENKQAIVDLLVKESNIDATLEIMLLSEDIRKKIRERFIDKTLRELAEKHNMVFSYDKGFYSMGKGGNRYNSIRFKIPGYDKCYFKIQSEGAKVYYGIVAEGYPESQQIVIGHFADWTDGINKTWAYGLKDFPGDLKDWSRLVSITDMAKGNKIKDIIDNELNRVIENKLIEKLDKKINNIE